MFWPTNFTDRSEDISFYLTCPECHSVNHMKYEWSSLKKPSNPVSTFGYVPTTFFYSKLTIFCPACSLRLDLNFELHPGGRMGECQYEIISAKSEKEKYTSNLLSKPPANLFPDAPAELPEFRPFSCASLHWYDNRWWETMVPNEWRLKFYDGYLFESKYGQIGLSDSRLPTLISGYQYISIPPNIESDAERIIYQDMRSEVDNSLGPDVKITRITQGLLVGYWVDTHSDGMGSGQGIFTSDEGWCFRINVFCTMKNFTYCWGTAQRIMASIKFYSDSNDAGIKKHSFIAGQL